MKVRKAEEQIWQQHHCKLKNPGYFIRFDECDIHFCKVSSFMRNILHMVTK